MSTRSEVQLFLHQAPILAMQVQEQGEERYNTKKDTEGSDTDEEPVPKVDKPYVNYLSQLSEVLSSKTF